MTKGMKSTEFWMSVFSALVPIVESLRGQIPSEYAVIITAVVTCAYNISRGLAKKDTVESPPPPVTPPTA